MAHAESSDLIVRLGKPLVRYQREGIMSPVRDMCWEASTKVGKTAPAVVWQARSFLQCGYGTRFDDAWRRDVEASGINIWFAPSYKQAAVAYRRAARAFGPAIRAGLIRTTKSPMSFVRLGPDKSEVARWDFVSTENVDAIYADECDTAVIDEASRHRSQADDAIQTLCTTRRAPRRYIGNVRDKVNWQYRMARAIEAGDPAFADGWLHMRTTIWDAVEAGIHQRAEIERIRATMAAKGALHIFRRDYEADPEGTNMAFPSDVLERCQDASPVTSGRVVLLVDPGGVSDPCGIVVCRVDPRGEEYTAEVIHAERWWGPSHRLEALVTQHVDLWSPSAIALDRAHDSLVSACRATWGQRVHVVSKRHMWDSYGVVRSMATSGALRIGSEWPELLDDMGNIALDGEELIVPRYTVERYVDGQRRDAQSHCDLAEALIRMGAVIGALRGREVGEMVTGSAGVDVLGYQPFIGW